uniref:Ig-like domain-containing protein n=1 Tax=Poecilia mexicana TaxID=48701 RepID=A0A3B3YGQ5_9TELE
MSVFLPDVCGQDGWGVSYSPSICALKGSTVEMSCNYTYPVIYKYVTIVIEKTFWFTEENNVDLKIDTDYSGRVEYQCRGNSCSLKIFNVRQADSKDYKFRFTTNHRDGKYTGSYGVSLSVTGKSYYLSQLVTNITVKVNRLDDPTRIQLTCHTDCQLPRPVSYVWLEDETPITTENENLFLSSFNTTHRYQCAIKGHEDVPSPAVYAPRTTVLSVTPSETVEGSSVTLTCSSDANPAAKYNIYRVNEGQHGQLLRTGPQSVFSSIQVSDTGRYYCTAGNDLGSQTLLKVYLMSVFLPDVCGQNGWAVSYSPSICALKGSTVEMSCNYTYPVIYKNVQIVIENTFWFTKESNGNYVALKDDRDYSDRVKYQCTENSCSLKISNVTQTDSKDYKFRFTTNRESGKYAGSPGVSLSVTGKSYYLSQLVLRCYKYYSLTSK